MGWRWNGESRKGDKPFLFAHFSPVSVHVHIHRLPKSPGLCGFGSGLPGGKCPARSGVPKVDLLECPKCSSPISSIPQASEPIRAMSALTRVVCFCFFFSVSLSSCKPGILLVARRWNLAFRCGLAGGCVRKWRHYGCTGLSKLPRGGCRRGRRDWIQNMYNLHFITYYWRSCTSCLENEAVITRWKPIMLSGLVLAATQGRARRSRVAVRQRGTRSEALCDPARASWLGSSCFS